MTKLSDEGKEVCDTIFDTLMGNVGMSEFHVPFDLPSVDDAECDSRLGIIKFEMKGKFYKMILTEE